MTKKTPRVPAERSPRSTATADRLNSAVQSNSSKYNPGTPAGAAAEQAARNSASKSAGYDRDYHSSGTTALDHVAGPVPRPSKGQPTPPNMFGPSSDSSAQ